MATRGITENFFTISWSRDSSDSSQGQDSCAICLGVPENKSYANNCLHEFCFSCLHKWSKVRAECPMCMQPFSSIIHTVKSDHDYCEHEIHRTDQCDSIVPETPLRQLEQVGQQLMFHQTPTRNHQPISFVATQHHTAVQNQTPASNFVGGARPRPNAMMRHVMVLAKQKTITQNQLAAQQTNIQTEQETEEAQSHGENITGLQSQMDRRNFPDKASSVNEFCPLNSSTPMRPYCTLHLSEVIADPVEQFRWWHNLVRGVIRNRMVQDLMQAIIPDPSFMNHKEMETVCAYTRKVESDIFMTADSKQHYFKLHSGKIKEFTLDMDQKQKKEFIQHILSPELDRPLDLSNPRRNNNPNFRLDLSDESSDGDEGSVEIEVEENDDKRKNVLGSTERSGESAVEERNFRRFNYQRAGGQVSFPSSEDDSEEIVILERPPKPVPELIILSDSDE